MIDHFILEDRFGTENSASRIYERVSFICRDETGTQFGSNFRCYGLFEMDV